MSFNTSNPPSQRASGCLFGLALGDALGAPTEFLRSAEQIRQRFPPNGPQAPLGDPARVTDDTQMTLAVGETLLAAPQPYTVATLEPILRRAFIDWMNSPENNRAPGMTCLNACERLERGLPWTKASIVGSKGCGANMRVAPVGVLPAQRPDGAGIAPETRAALAQFQGALTHGHPTALAASDLTAWAIADLVAGGDTEGLPRRLREYALSQRDVYHGGWLGTLWEQVGIETPQSFIARGWDECLGILDRLEAALETPDREADPCFATGEGWIAEEAFGTGMLCFLLFPEKPIAALRRAAVTCGDSDSIACLAGAFAGAHHGLAAWPEEWLRRIEYRDRLAAMGTAWDG